MLDILLTYAGEGGTTKLSPASIDQAERDANAIMDGMQRARSSQQAKETGSSQRPYTILERVLALNRTAGPGWAVRGPPIGNVERILPVCNTYMVAVCSSLSHFRL